MAKSNEGKKAKIKIDIFVIKAKNKADLSEESNVAAFVSYNLITTDR